MDNIYETDHSKLLHGMRHGFSIIGERNAGKSRLLRFILENLFPTAGYAIDAETLKLVCEEGNQVVVANVESISTEDFSAAIANTTSTVIPIFVSTSTQPRIDWQDVCKFDVELSIGHEYPIDKPFGKFYIKKQCVNSHQYNWFVAVPVEPQSEIMEPFDIETLSTREV
jgi:hypothetical protein